ncbi:MAG: HAD-IC family P-type ATPase [Candidatus Saccharibacteria bacterium]|nr:HAD-IC family P-type ATPase [Candidatus Saccharibacteria bacterium]
MNLPGLTRKKTTKTRQNHSIGQIIARNTFTIFNLVNIILAVMIFAVGSYKNLLFIFIAVANTLISIVNEIRAKKIIDKMRLISEKHPTILQNGKSYEINPEDIQKGDVIILALGDQILVDSTVKEGTVEVNESFITGESDNIVKHPGDKLTSGSFVVSGTCQAVASVSVADSFITKLETTAHAIKPTKSKLFTIMNNIVKYISFALIPIGLLLLWARFRVPGTTTEVAVTSTVAALINMIPEGLILLTSSVLALATVRLGRKQVLVQDLYSIETLARVDCICLDKTGTLTTGRMKVKELIPAKGQSQKSLESTLMAILSQVPADNATSTALKAKLPQTAKFKPTEQVVEIIPFSSDRKYSGIVTRSATYLMGAMEFITQNPDFLAQERKLPNNYRIISVIKKSADKETLIGFALLEDEIRRDAHKIIDFFNENDVAVKIISGDNLSTVQNIANTVGLSNTSAVDLSTLKNINYEKLVKDYNIFTRVKPAQKKSLILALKKQGRTVAMTGDGVNDILAMKEADCSIAIGEGSDAARRSAKLVLLGSDFAAVPSIIAEGRQSINNLERSTALFLAKTVYASILAVIFVFLPMQYPFTPIEMSLLNFACIGFPGLVLSLEHNTDRIKNNFTKNILTYSFPIGLTVSFCMAALSIVSHLQGFSHPELTTISVFVTFTIDLVLIYWISKPLNKLRAGLLISIIGIMAAAFVIPLIRDFFEFIFLTPANLIVMAAIIAAGLVVFELMRRLMQKITTRIFNASPHLNL